MQAFTQRVILLIGALPKGKVASYGDIARAAESPRATRQVVRILHAMSARYQLPWWRVVNKSGEISIADDAGAELQRQHLLSEGVEVDESGGIVAFASCRVDTVWLHAQLRQ